MPFRSKAQRRWMHAVMPALARKWEKHTPKGAQLPERARMQGALAKRRRQR